MTPPPRPRPPVVLPLLALTSFLCVTARGQDPVRVGPADGGGVVVPTEQLIRPAGDVVQVAGRPVDLVVSPDGKTVFVKDEYGVVVIDAAAWRVRQELRFPDGGGSLHGIVLSPDGSHLYASCAQDLMWEGIVSAEGKVSCVRKIPLPGRGGRAASHACGLALVPGGKQLLVCLSLNNTLGVVDLADGKLAVEIPVGVAPFDVALSPDGRTAYVSNWGGTRPVAGEPAAPSGGTPVHVDKRGVADRGSVSVVDLKAAKELAQVQTGLHPSDVELGPGGKTLYVANANSDTVSVIDVAAPAAAKVVEAIGVRPDPSLPFGSASNALAVSKDGRTLFVANGGNNAVAVVALREKADGRSRVAGFVPAGWYPGAVATDGKSVFVANVKGVGSRRPPAGGKPWHVKNFLGTVGRVAVPTADELKGYTARVLADARVPQALRGWERAQDAKGMKPLPVPGRTGEPSVFEHVVYVIKENRTYDQILGDAKAGNGDASLCIFPEEVTPNHHALAAGFVLLDNFYCNGVLSADGHAWATEGFVTDAFEKTFGGFTRAYFAGDALTFSPAGFVWDNVLLHGLSFRNYGEKDFPTLVPVHAGYAQVYDDFARRLNRVRVVNHPSLEPLAAYSCPGYPGWNLAIPDVVRADVFARDLAGYEKDGRWPNFMTVYLPGDHTAGTSPGNATPRAMMAANDLALGRIVDAVSHSRFWATTCVFVIEDDPQSGFDHVDGHRSVCLVASPYTKRGRTIGRFYNQSSVLRTMELMLGLPPMNQMDAMATPMTECFTDKPDPAPYAAVPNRVPLDEMNPWPEGLRGDALGRAKRSAALDLSEPDKADEDALNRVLWHAAKGEAAYPAKWAGAHGRGLKDLGLKADRSARGEGEDD